MTTYEIQKLEFNKKTYIAKTQNGDKVIQSIDDIATYFDRKGLDLCAIVNKCAKDATILIDESGHLVDKTGLAAELRSHGRPQKLKKSARCLCGETSAKGDKALLHNFLIVGCDSCTEVSPKVRSEREEHEFRVVLDGPYDHCLEHVNDTRDKFRKKFQDRMFRVGVLPGAHQGTLVYVANIDGLVGHRSVEDFNTFLPYLKHLEFGRYKEDPETGEEIWMPCPPPQGIVTHMLAHKDEKIPVLHGLVRLPIISPEGEVISEIGYNPSSRVYLAPDVELEPIPEHVSDDDLIEAKALLDYLFCDFPFAYEGAKSAAIGCFIDQCVRASLIDGPTPAYCFEAPTGSEGTGKCQSFRMLALGSFGLKRIENLSPSRQKDGDDIVEEARVEVPTLDGSIQSTSHFYHGGKKKCLRLTTRRGFINEGTLVHPILTQRMEWKQLQDVRVGDYIATYVSRHPGAKEDKVDQDFAWLLGSLTADGALNISTGATPTYTKNDKNLRHRVKKLYERYTGGEAIEIAPKDEDDAWHLNLNGKKDAHEKLASVGLSFALSKEKSIPYAVMESSSKVWAAFIQGLFDGDGSVDSKGIEWTSASERLAEEVQVMLASLGVWSARNEKTVCLSSWNEPRTYYRIHIMGADVDAFAENVGLSHEQKKAALLAYVQRGKETGRNINVDVVPFVGDLIKICARSRPRPKRTKEEGLWKSYYNNESFPSRAKVKWMIENSEPSEAREKLKMMSADHIRWDRVERIEDIGEQQVYDLTVPVNHSFISNGLIVHNSLLSSTIAYLADGSTTSATIWRNDEDELAKQLLPLIESQRNIIMFDNVDGFITSATLDSTITSRVYETRRLGRNSMRDMVKVPFRSSIVFTSNGATFQNSMARRMVMIQLDFRRRKTSVDERGARQYTIPNIIAHVRDKTNRAKYIRAAFILTKAWLQAGRPIDPQVVPLHSFETWSDVVPAIVRYAGWSSMNRAILAASEESNGDRREAAEFVHAWWNRFGSVPIRAHLVGEVAIDGGFYVDRMKVSNRTPNPAYVGRSINKRYMGFVRRWPVKLNDGTIVQVEEGPKDVGQPTWYIKVLSEPLKPSGGGLQLEGSNDYVSFDESEQS